MAHKAPCIPSSHSVYSYVVKKERILRQCHLRLKVVFATGQDCCVLQSTTNVVCQRPEHSLDWFQFFVKLL